MNIDFNADPAFSTYVVLLVFSGIAMLAMSSVRGSTRGLRALNIAFGIGFVCYGFYLAFLFQGGSYFIFFKAFILPIVMAVRTARGWFAQRGAAPQVLVPAEPVPASDASAAPAEAATAPEATVD